MLRLREYKMCRYFRGYRLFKSLNEAFHPAVTAFPLPFCYPVLLPCFIEQPVCVQELPLRCVLSLRIFLS
jgi:hypothetical protein